MTEEVRGYIQVGNPKIEDLQKRVAALEAQLQERPKLIPKDSDGVKHSENSSVIQPLDSPKTSWLEKLVGLIARNQS